MLGIRSWCSTAMNKENWRQILSEAKTQSCTASDDGDDEVPRDFFNEKCNYFNQKA
jgi:hypothetical protein